MSNFLQNFGYDDIEFGSLVLKTQITSFTDNFQVLFQKMLRCTQYYWCNNLLLCIEIQLNTLHYKITIDQKGSILSSLNVSVHLSTNKLLTQQKQAPSQLQIIMAKKGGHVIDQYRLTQEGQTQHSKLSVSSFRSFLFWLFVGNCAGFTVAKFIPLIRPKMSPERLKRYQFGWLNVCVLIFGWYGYKVAQYKRKIGLSQIVRNPQNIEDIQTRIVQEKNV